MGKVMRIGTTCGARVSNGRAGADTDHATRARGTHGGDGDGRVAEVEELVHAGEDHGPEDADEPRPERRDGHRGVVVVGDGGAHLWVRRVVLCTASYQRGARARTSVALTEPGGIDIEVRVEEVGDGRRGRGAHGRRRRVHLLGDDAWRGSAGARAAR